MKSASTILAGLAVLSLHAAALASEAETSARAGSDRGRNGTAEASARYEGEVGVARTETRSGRVSFSISNAVAGPAGRAFANNFNLSLGRDGSVAVSGGRAASLGSRYRSASAGGSTTARRGFSQAISSASGRSDRNGLVRSRTFARSHESRRIIRYRRVYRNR